MQCNECQNVRHKQEFATRRMFSSQAHVLVAAEIESRTLRTSGGMGNRFNEVTGIQTSHVVSKAHKQ
jgi:hypothetical protein